MSSVLAQEMETGRQQIFYCRKEKSLGVLVSNFLRLYNRDGIDLIGLDDAANKLGVERRRIYDVVNILESVGLVARRGKNQYSWKGFGEVPRALKELREEGLRENFGVNGFSNTSKASSDNEDEEPFSSQNEDQDNSSSYSKADNKREKSLWLLAQNFVKLFLCSDFDLITLDSAAKALLTESQDSVNMRTKIRRLYDIANVFASMNLIEKTHMPASRKPAYRWLGWKGKPDNGSAPPAAAGPDLNEPKTRVFGMEITNISSERNKAELLNLNEPKKRLFGTDITNFSSKRNKADSSSAQMSKQKENLPVLRKDNRQNSYYANNKMEQHPKQNTKSFVFGPFTPSGVSRNSDPRDNSIRRVQDLECLASTYRPQYHNQALKDLFGHYMEAWKSWYAEFTGECPDARSHALSNSRYQRS